MSNQLGVVVVGIGMAGRVRIRDLLQSASQCKELMGLKLHGFVSRRDLSLEGTTQLSLEEALQNPEIGAIIVCTENQRHEEIARRAIENKKHVLVEFPLALNAQTATELISEAKQKGVVCYEEDISLLTDRHDYVKQQVKQKSQLTEGKIWLEGSFNGWIEDHEKSGSAFHSSIEMIHGLVDIFGQVTPVQAKIVREEKSLFSEGKVQIGEGGTIDISIKREVLERPKRDTGFCYKFSDGTEIDSKTLVVPVQSDAPKKPGLFLQDLIQFMSVVQGDKDGSEQLKISLKSLEIADALFALAKQNPESKL